jgi:hypothetical protein
MKIEAKTTVAIAIAAALYAATPAHAGIPASCLNITPNTPSIHIAWCNAIKYPRPPAPPPASTTPSNPSQPAAKGGGSSFLSKGGWAMIGVMVYFGLVIYEREKWCAENPDKCYMPLRDGMP